MIQLRDYQADIIDRTRASLRVHKSTLIVLPTGGGKTALSVFMLGSACKRDKKGWFIVHRAELIYQTSLTFEKFGISHSFIAAGMAYDPASAIHIISIDTLKSRIHELVHPAISVWDEAHHIVAPGWLEVKQAMDQTLHVGLTASPERLNGQGLGEAFNDIVEGPSMRWLIQNGYLSDYDYYNPVKPNLDGLGNSQGDYNSSQSGALMAQPKIMGDIVKAWKELAAGKITVGFAPNRKTSQKLADMFNAAGIQSAHIDGSTAKDVRKGMARKLATGEIMVLWNVALLSEGYDLSAQAGTDVTIDCVIDAAPTHSLVNFLQRCGRSLRKKADGSNAVIIDCANNWKKHQLPDTPRTWSLQAQRRNVRAANDPFYIKQCGECYFVHEPAPKCPACWFEYPVQSHEVKIDTDAEFRKLEKEQHEAKVRDMHNRVKLCRTFEDFKQLAADMGYSPGWAWHRYNARKRKA
ncbi:helicase [Pararheinheimera phage vB_PsoM_KLER1-1]|nr:helicase [Pararheinheimera phage vB_PsoM_KLER1-1]